MTLQPLRRVMVSITHLVPEAEDLSLMTVGIGVI